MKTRHLSTYPGKRVTLVMRDGRRTDGKFVQQTGQYVVLDTGRYEGRDIRAMLVGAKSRHRPSGEKPCV